MSRSEYTAFLWAFRIAAIVTFIVSLGYLNGERWGFAIYWACLCVVSIVMDLRIADDRSEIQ